MFYFEDDKKENCLFVTIPKEIKYDFEFLASISELMKKAQELSCKEIRVSYENKAVNFSKMSAGYLYNTLRFLARKRNVFLRKPLYQVFNEKVQHSGGEKFRKIDLEKEALSPIQQCYQISGDNEVERTVQILVEFILEHNLILENAKEFLITTIGEIFSNAFNHSDEKEVFFMYDIEFRKPDIFLVINVTDYGKTIIHNVQNYQREMYGLEMESTECIRWAFGKGNTTRRGSGGYGLPTLVDYINEIQGELLIFSGDTIYTLGEEERLISSEGNFSGTSVTMRIPLFNTNSAFMYDERRNKIVSIDLDKI